LKTKTRKPKRSASTTSDNGHVESSTRVLSNLVDAELAIERERVSLDIRISHLDLQDRTCIDSEETRDKLLEIEHWIEGRISRIICDHPAYHWFSKVRGVGKENIGKCISGIRIKPEKGYRKNKATGDMELVDLPYASTISGVWSYIGFGLDEDNKAMRKVSGEKLRYNADLRTMWWRLGSSLLKTSIRHKCSKCGELVGQSSIPKHKCADATFRTVTLSKFSAYYLKEKDKYTTRFINEGCKIVPAEQLPKNAEGKRYEPEGIKSEGHIHNMAMRKMLKLFAGCLFLVWREAEGLPPTKPYAIDILKHDTMIHPWDMVDKE